MEKSRNFWSVRENYIYRLLHDKYKIIVSVHIFPKNELHTEKRFQLLVNIEK